jgi:hydroxymethylglutaryl-CoA lyase
MKIIESPREAMQGLNTFIPTDVKVRYINSLLKVGFDTLEVGSFVSHKAIPQMKDSLQVLEQVEKTQTRSKRMILVVNKIGAEQASRIDSVDVISFPFSISPRFTELNLNSNTDKLLKTLDDIVNICDTSKKSLVVYISMAFGNPYGDDWSLEILSDWVNLLSDMGVTTIPLSNVTIETSSKLIEDVFSFLIPQNPGIELGLHLHTSNDQWYEKVNAAYKHGCKRFDGVMNGMGGCPMTGKEMLGNLATENLIQFLQAKNEIPEGFDQMEFNEAGKLASEIFNLKNK